MTNVMTGAFDHSKRVPTESSISTFVETYLNEFCPEGANSPAGDDWIRPFTYRRVRRKLADKFGAPEHAFYALDDDDSGSLTRAEVGTGLQALGIRLNAAELGEFVEQLDLDGGGKIEVEEVRGPPALPPCTPGPLCASAPPADGFVRLLLADGPGGGRLPLLSASSLAAPLALVCAQLVDFWNKYATEVFV